MNAGAVAVEPGGEFGRDRGGVAGEEGAERAVGVEGAGGVAGELGLDVEVDFRGWEFEPEMLAEKAAAEFAEDVDAFAETLAAVVVAEVGPDRVEDRAAADTLAGL